MKRNYYSQYGQDFFLAKLFKGKRKGTFVDIGAYDGVTFSNTYYLEKNLEWKGLCVEPNPTPFKKLKAARNSININCGIGTSTVPLQFLALTGAGEMLSGFTSTFDVSHYARIDAMEKVYQLTKSTILIEVTPLADLLHRVNMRTVDYCNIDVEGGEMEVLKSIDFDSITIKLISVENNLGTKDAQAFLKPLGYRKIWKIGSDEFYERYSRRYGFILRFKWLTLRKRVSYFKNKFINKSR